MAKTHTVFICQQCGYQSSQFLGKCPECNTWGSLVEQVAEAPYISSSKSKKKHFLNKEAIVNLKDVEKQHYQRISTKNDEFDRVLGGGIVMGSVVLIAGDPGVGKSTLLSQLAINVNSSNLTNGDVLYVAGEESPHQIKLRIDRMAKDVSLDVLNETDVDVIIEAVRQVKPTLVIVDSIQTLETQDLSAAAGSVSQVKECSHRLQRIAKELHVPIFIVGHVTKEGTVAGPRTLEHLVDVVLSLEGESTSNFRMLRGMKNRFGPTDEVGIFEMDEKGLREIKNPSEIFLDQKVNAPGSVVVPIVTGLRPILIEIQALVTKSYIPVPRRAANGIDNNRVQLLIAVLSKRLKLPLYDQDIFVNVTGGIKITEPAVDLGICMAVVSSFKDISVKKDTAFVGEVGLLGELRPVRQLEKRIKEAQKLGFIKVISPPEVKSLADAVTKGLDGK